MRGKILSRPSQPGLSLKPAFLVPAFRISRIFLIDSPIMFNGTPDKPFYIARMTIIE
jgi:hypothetical protein